MPKEVFKSDVSSESAEVRWYNFPEADEGRGVIPEIVAVGVSTGQEFKFLLDETDEVYDTLYFNFTAPEQVDEFIKALRRAKRKVFENVVSIRRVPDSV